MFFFFVVAVGSAKLSIQSEFASSAVTANGVTLSKKPPCNSILPDQVLAGPLTITRTLIGVRSQGPDVPTALVGRGTCCTTGVRRGGCETGGAALRIGCETGGAVLRRRCETRGVTTRGGLVAGDVLRSNGVTGAGVTGAGVTGGGVTGGGATGAGATGAGLTGAGVTGRIAGNVAGLLGDEIAGRIAGNAAGVRTGGATGAGTAGDM